jgi:LAO/AO transport system kinase
MRGAGAAAELLARVTKRRRSLSHQQYVDGILRGERTVLAQAITLIESSRAADRELAEQIVEDCLPHSGNSIRVGITGVPGAGKSSVIEVLGTYFDREAGKRSPCWRSIPAASSPAEAFWATRPACNLSPSSDMAFIRPSPSRGSLGGVAQRTREAMLLCEAAGYQNILVETVGVGQSETAVHDMVDFFLLIMLTGAGDELQGIKRGVMELADLVVINKADGSESGRRGKSADRGAERIALSSRLRRRDGRRARLPARRKRAKASPSFGSACWSTRP